MRKMKNGTPITEITAPMGSSPTVKLLQNTSAARRANAPATMLVGSRTRWSPPTTMRHRWGTMSPTNPMMPQNETQNAVSTAIRMSMLRLKTLEFRPRYLACSSPVSIVFRFLAWSIVMMRMIATGIVIRIALSQFMLAKLPNIHVVMLWSLSALNDIIRVAPALIPNPMIVPPRT